MSTTRSPRRSNSPSRNMLSSQSRRVADDDDDFNLMASPFVRSTPAVTNPPRSRSVSPSGYTGQARTPASAPAAAPAAPAAAPSAALTGSSVTKFGVSTNHVDNFLHNYRANIKHASQRARAIPLLALLKALKSYCNSKLNEYPKEIDSMFENAIDAVSSGRPVGGEDADSHIATLIEKLNIEGIDLGFMMDVRAKTSAELEKIRQDMLGKFLRQENGLFKKSTRGKNIEFSASEVAGLAMKEISSTSAKDYFTQSLSASPAVLRALRVQAAKEPAGMKPGFYALCKYLAENVDGSSLSESVASAIVTCLLKEHTNTRTAMSEDGKEYKQVFFRVPKGGFMTDADSYSWTPKSGKSAGQNKKFTSVGSYYEIALDERQQLMNFLFNKRDVTVSTVDQASLGVICTLPDTDKI